MLSNCGAGEDSWESFGQQRDQTSQPKGNQPWIFIGRTDAEAEAPILWPSDTKSWLFGKEPDDGKDWGQKEKGVTEDEMVGWHHRLNERKFEQTLGAGEGQGRPVCCFYRVAKSRTGLSDWTTAARTANLSWITLLCKVSQPICTWSRQLSHKRVLWATRPISERLWLNQ